MFYTEDYSPLSTVLRGKQWLEDGWRGPVEFIVRGMETLISGLIGVGPVRS